MEFNDILLYRRAGKNKEFRYTIRDCVEGRVGETVPHFFNLP